MSKRAEERAMEVYPVLFSERDGYPSPMPDRRNAFVKGYEQAEKDLALTWEDIQKITDIHRDVLFENPKRIMFSKENYEDTLVRFNKLREGK